MKQQIMTRQEESEKLKQKIDILLKWGYTFHFSTSGEGTRGINIKEIVIQPYATDGEITTAVENALNGAESFYNIAYNHIRAKKNNCE